MSGILFAFCLVSCADKKNTENNNVTKVKTIVPVETTLNTRRKNIGTISYKSKHEVSTSVEGSVLENIARKGEYVKKGQVICKLKNIQLEIQKEQCENALEEAKASLLIAEAKLRDDMLSVKSRMITAEKQELSIRQQELEYEEACAQYENEEKLYLLGGVTKTNLMQHKLKISAMKTSLDVAKKEYEICSLGFREEDVKGILRNIPYSKDEREKMLVEINTMSSEANVRSEKSRVKNAEKNLLSINRLNEELNLKATVDGIVGAVSFEEGEHVDVNSTIFTLMDTSSVNVVFYVQENDIGLYETGNLISVEIPSVKKIEECRITEISPLADPVTGNFEIKALVSNDDNLLKPGMFAKIEIENVEDEKYLSIPASSVVFSDRNAASVFILVKGIAVSKSIKIKENFENRIIVEHGIEPKDKIVERPSPFLKEGEKIEEI